MVASVRLPLYCLVVSLLSFCLSWLSVIRHYLSPCSHTFRFFMRCLSLSACPYLSLHLPSLFSISTPMPISSFVIPWYISSLSVPLAFYFFPSYLFVPIVLSVFLCTSYPPPPCCVHTFVSPFISRPLSRRLDLFKYHIFTGLITHIAGQPWLAN